jgi:hypothetical protein
MLGRFEHGLEGIGPTWPKPAMLFEAFFQLEPPSGDRLAERKEVYEAPRAVLHPMGQACE